MPEQTTSKTNGEETTEPETQVQQAEEEDNVDTEDGTMEKSDVRRNPFAPDHLPEFDIDDEVSAKSSSGGVTRKVVARIVKRQTNPRRYYEYRLSSPADTSKWYRESELDYA